MRRRVPLTICLIGGIGMMIQFFIPHPASQKLYEEVIRWVIIIGAFSLVLGIQSLFSVHYDKIQHHRPGWGYSIVTLTSMAIVAIIGLFWGVGEDSLFMQIYRHIMVPLQATMFSLLAFFMASASFRAFKARTIPATLLLITALIVMFGRVPIGAIVFPRLPDIVEWILVYPNMAAQRGILLGVGLGMMATSLKIMLGIERGWLGG
ncbi:MAG: hypothetical protein QMD71_05890 [bacterium]|nr:hypothetical protein [bacterium]